MADIRKPNILVVITDQQRWDSLGCYGNKSAHTPCIDRLAANGTVFERAYCCNPVCTPSRVSIFTGMHVGSHGAWNIGTVAQNPETFVSSIFRENGYSTGYIGKMHFGSWAASREDSPESWSEGWEEYFTNFKTPYYGFDHVELSMGHTSFGHFGHYGLWLREQLKSKAAVNFKRTTQSGHKYGAEAYDWEIPIELHNSTWVAERTVNALKKAKRENKPFFLVAGFQDPHHPHCLPVELVKEIDTKEVPDPHFTEGELRDKPPHFMLAYEGKRSFPSKEKYRKEKDFPDAFKDVTLEETRLSRAYYYKMCELIDRSLEKIVRELEASGMMENTIVIFTSDHGELLGDHGLWRKGPFHYEQLIRVPLIMHWPCGIKHNSRINSIASLVDIVPTLLSAVGLKITEKLDGKDLMPVLRNERQIVREHAWIEYVDDPDELRLKTVVTGRYKLTLYHQRDFGELYDLEKDPWETINLFSDPGMKDVKIELMRIIMDEMERTEEKLRLKRFASS